MADGRIQRTGSGARKSSAGYDLTALMVGSEGTLGRITELTLRLQSQPEAVAAATCAFTTIEQAVDAVTATIAMARIEFLDAASVAAVNAYSKMNFPTQPHLMIEFHGSKRGFLHAVKGKSDADMQTIANYEVFEALAVGSDLCLSDNHSAHDAFAREIIAHETTDWTEQDLGLKGEVPFVMMNGLQDPQVTPETLAEFKRDYPWIEFDVFEDAGQLLFFSKWPQVTDRR